MGFLIFDENCIIISWIRGELLPEQEEKLVREALKTSNHALAGL